MEERWEKAQEEKRRTYSESCDYPGCSWQSGDKSSAEEARASLRGHKGRNHPDYDIVVNKNGHHSKEAAHA
jgi:hypothetical protein